MLKILLSLLVSSGLAAPCEDGTQPFPGGTCADSAAIAALHAREAAAAKNPDAGILPAVWSDDIVTLWPGESPVRGRSANEARLARAIADGYVASADDLLQIEEVMVAGDIAYEWGRYPIDKPGYVMRILARQPDGSWKIARTISAPAATEHDVEIEVETPRAERRFTDPFPLTDLFPSLPRLGNVPCIPP